MSRTSDCVWRPLFAAVVVLCPVGTSASAQCDSWQPLESGIDDYASAMLPHNGELIVGGNFQNAGGQPVNFIARLNGNEWKPLGTGMDSTVSALCEQAQGVEIALRRRERLESL